MIIGVALVVDDLTKGQRLVFRYPISVPSSILNSHASILQFHQDYLSITPDNFARLFRPKAQLFNKILEISIDDIHYISYPCPCIDDTNSAEVNGNTSANADVISLFNVIIAVVEEDALKKVLDQVEQSQDYKNVAIGKQADCTQIPGFDPVASIFGLREKVKAVNPRVLCKVVESFSKALLFHEKRNKYVSKQVAILLRLLESNVVKNDVSSNSVNTNALISSNANVSNSSSNNTGATNFDGSNVVNEKTMYRDYSIMDMMLQQSSLANELRTLFHGLIGGHSINLTINGVLSLNVRLTEHLSENDIKGYQTLLTIADSDNLHRIISALDVSAGAHSNPSNKLLNSSIISPLIQNMIKVCDPTMSFTELSIILQEPLFEVINMANQLHYWGLGKIASTVTMKSIYRIHPLAPTCNVSSAAKVFSSTFLSKLSKIDKTMNIHSNVSFTSILSLFNGSHTVENIIALVPFQLKPHFIDILVWLLRWNFLVECKCHIMIDPYKSTDFSGMCTRNDEDFLFILRNNYQSNNNHIQFKSNFMDDRVTSFTDDFFRIRYSKLPVTEFLMEYKVHEDEILVNTNNSTIQTIIL